MESLTKVADFRFKIYPKDFGAMRSFYSDTLGYPITKEWDRGESDRGVMFDVGTATLELLTPEEGYKPLQGIGLSLEVKDVVALYEVLKEKTNVLFTPRHNEWGDTSFRITDPEGLELTFFTKD